MSADISLLRPPVQNCSLTSQPNIIWLFLSSDGVFAGLLTAEGRVLSLAGPRNGRSGTGTGLSSSTSVFVGRVA